jgi:hypothetical protein
MKIGIFLILIFSSYNLFSQYENRNIQVSLHTAGRIIDVSPIASSTGQALNLTSIIFHPRLGYSINGKYSFGLIGMYGFAHSTVGDAPSVRGAGYYLKYSFMPREDTTKKFKRFVPFILYEHLVANGYYSQNYDFRPVKINKTVNYFGLQGGVDVKTKVGFSVGFSGGFGSASFYKNDDITQGTRLQILPYGLVIFQYNFKL